METVGNKLKNLRLQKGLSLEDVHKKTKIHLNILKAIEEDSLVNFSPVYIKGFLKIYSKFLGVDPKECVSDYKEPKTKLSYVPDLEERSFRMPSLNLFSIKAMFMKSKAFLLVILAVILIIGLFSLGKSISAKARSRHPERIVMPAVIAPKAEHRVSAPKLSNLPLARIITLDVHAKENCFLQVKSDGKLMFQNILRKGRFESWQAKEKIELSLGNAGVVELEVNGKRIPELGRRGQAVKNILITKEGLNIKR